MKSWDTKDHSDNLVARKLAVRCSPRIRNHIIDKCKGYIYINLLRCKVFDRFYVPQCFHCQRYNHFSNSCPDKNKRPICGKCSGQHDTKNCKQTVRKCANCVRFKESEVNHATFASSCPSLDKARRVLMSKTNYLESKN